MIISNVDPKEFVYDYDHISKEECNFDYYKKYYELHSKGFLQPTTIKVDVELFAEEIKSYHQYFRRWGNNRNHLPRFGISLANADGNIKGEEDIACGPLDMYNRYVEQKVSESDFKVLTEVYYNLESLRVFDPIKEYLLRSSILLWHKEGSFLPHLDAAPRQNFNYRLWGVNNPNGYIFDYMNNKVVNVEPGRIYLCDTSLFHWAKATEDWVYTFFISVNNSDSCYSWLENNLL